MAELIVICIFIFAMACLDESKKECRYGCDDDEVIDAWEDETVFEKPILLIDMDGVIADYYGHFISIWKKTYPDRVALKASELKGFYFEDSYPAEYTSDIRNITTDIGFFENLPPVPGAVTALTSILENDKFKVFLCSTPDSHSKNQCCSSEKVRWVERVLGPDWVKRIILTHDKTLVHGDYLIDDKPHIVGAKESPSWSQIVFTHEYNKHMSGFTMNSWSNWPEIEQEILNDFEN